MSQRHAAIAALLSAEARRELVAARPEIRYRLGHGVPRPTYDELDSHHLVSGMYLTARGEVVREYVLEMMLP